MTTELILTIVFAISLAFFVIATIFFRKNNYDVEIIKRYKNNLTIIDTVRISEELADILHSKCPNEDYKLLKEEILRILCS